MPVPLPSWPKGKPYKEAPTFEALHKRSGIKVAKLRELLRDVAKFKCPDNTVRYDEAAATAAIDGTTPDLSSDETAEGLPVEPLPSDPVQASLQLMNRTLALLGTVVRERGEIVKLCNETIKTMGEPMKLGQELVRENQQLMRERLGKYDDQQLEMFALIEELHSRKDERARDVVRDAERTKLRGETMALAKQYLPTALDRFQLTMEAKLALELLGAVDPDLLAGVADQLLPKEMQPKVPALVAMLRARRAAAARKGAANGATETTGETTSEGTPPVPPS
jgi:hypothetical protein